MGRTEMNKWITMLRNRYFRFGAVVLVTFIVISILEGFAAAALGSLVVAMVLVYFSFDPRIKRHW